MLPMPPRHKDGLGIKINPQQPDVNPSRSRRQQSFDLSANVNNSVSTNLVSMRSTKGMSGLLLAEVGGSMVQLDAVAYHPSGSGFKEGSHIEPGTVTPQPLSRNSSLPAPQPSRLKDQHFVSQGGVAGGGAGGRTAVPRTDTLLNMYASPARKATELKTLLGDSSAKVKHGAVVQSHPGVKGKSKTSSDTTVVAFEQGKSRARVSLDLELDNGVIVEGNPVTGRMHIHVHPPSSKRNLSQNDTAVSLGEGKLRIAGFEVVHPSSSSNNPNSSSALRHIFYQVSAPLSDISDIEEGARNGWTFPQDEERFSTVEDGEYTIPFSMVLPLSNGGKPKGVIVPSNTSPAGVMIRYIVIVSMKVIDPTSGDTGARSIAHFYRDCEVWPRLDPFAILSVLNPTASHPSSSHHQSIVRASSSSSKHQSKKSSMTGKGAEGEQDLHVAAELARSIWVAGQNLHVSLLISNHTDVAEAPKKKRKKVKDVRSVTLALVRTTTVYKPSPRLDHRQTTVGRKGNELDADEDACETTTTERRIAEEVLVAGERHRKGSHHVSARGWWMGIEAGERKGVVCSIGVPPDALTVNRARLFEVQYSLRVSLGVSSLMGISPDAVVVTLPVRIVNFLSIDPPPPPPSIPAPSSRNDCLLLSTPRPGQYHSDLQQMISQPSSRYESRVQTGGGGHSSSGLPVPSASVSLSHMRMMMASSSVSTTNSASSTTSSMLPRSRGFRIHPNRCKPADSVGLAATKSGRREGVAHVQVPPLVSHSSENIPADLPAPVPRKNVKAKQDWGGFEDEEEIEDVLFGDISDIPGSVSMLERSDLGLSADECSFRSEQHKYQEGRRRRVPGGPRPGKCGKSRTHAVTMVVDDGEAEWNNVEEGVLDAAVSCASELAGNWNGDGIPTYSEYEGGNLAGFGTMSVSMTMAGLAAESQDDDGDDGEENCPATDVSPSRLLYERRGICNRITHLHEESLATYDEYREEDTPFSSRPVIVKDPDSPRKHTFSERVQVLKTQNSPSKDDTSPTSMYSSATPAPNQTGSHIQMQTSIKFASHPSQMERAYTTPSSSTKRVTFEPQSEPQCHKKPHALVRSADMCSSDSIVAASNTSPSLVRHRVLESRIRSNTTSPSVSLANSGDTPMSSVKARIAMLEEQHRLVQ